MLFGWYEVIWLFFIYSFLGWSMEVIHAAYGVRRLINRGFLNGIVCPVYGFSMVFLSVFLDSLKNNCFYLFLGCMIIGSVIELVTGVLLEKVFRTRLWDYSGMRFQVGGYVCLKYSILWGIMGTLLIKLVNPFLLNILHHIPKLAGEILLIVFIILLILDTVTTILVLGQGEKRTTRVGEIVEGFSQASDSLCNAITVKVQRRIERAFPEHKNTYM